MYVAYFFQGNQDEVPSPQTFESMALTLQAFRAFTIDTGNAIPYETEIDNGFGEMVPVIEDSAYAEVYGPFTDGEEILIALMDMDRRDGVGVVTDLGEPSARIEFGPRGGIHVRTAANTSGEVL